MSFMRAAGRLIGIRSGARMPLHIRDMTGADRHAVVAMLAALSAYERRFETDRTGDPAAADAGLAEVEAEIAAAGGFILVAARDAGVAVGFASVVVRTDSPYIAERFRRTGYVSDLFVVEAERNRGVGRALLDETVRRARAQGIFRIGIGALARNDATRAAYTRWGFRAYAVEHVLDLD